MSAAPSDRRPLGRGLHLGFLLTDARGPIGGHQPGWKISRQPGGNLTLQRRRHTMGGSARHPEVLRSQRLWNLLDARWQQLPQERRVEWQRCTRRYSRGHRSGLDEFRHVNMCRMRHQMPALDSPPIREARHGYYVPRHTHRSRGCAPPDPFVPIDGLCKNGDPFDADRGSLDLPPPYQIRTCPTNQALKPWQHIVTFFTIYRWDLLLATFPEEEEPPVHPPWIPRPKPHHVPLVIKCSIWWQLHDYLIRYSFKGGTYYEWKHDKGTDFIALGATGIACQGGEWGFRMFCSYRIWPMHYAVACPCDYYGRAVNLPPSTLFIRRPHKPFCLDFPIALSTHLAGWPIPPRP